jgi:hypothetical protein
MSYSRACAVSKLFAVIAVVLPANAQSVVSTHSGVIHFFEGAVFLGDEALEPRLGIFPSVLQGEELRTADGRAEVLLTPGVFLRMGQSSAIRMVASNLANTQVELQKGAVIVDSEEPSAGTSVTLIYKDWKVHFLQKGFYRIDSDPPSLWVRRGEAEVFAGANGQPVAVEGGMRLPFAGVLVPEVASAHSNDALSDWANGRSESISADNAIMAEIDEDPASRTTGLDSFTYFPFLGVPSPGLGLSSPYSSYTPLYQPGFNSIYLPGYTYRPLILGLVGPSFRTYPPRRIGISPGASTISPYPRAPISRPAPLRPAAPHIGVRGVGHR